MASRICFVLWAIAVSKCVANEIVVEGSTTMSPEKMETVATCVVDVTQATNKLAAAGLAIQAASKSCSMVVLQGRQKAACAHDLSGVLASIGYMASFLSKAAATCGATHSIPAACGGDVSYFVASLATLSGAGASVEHTCDAVNMTGADFAKYAGALVNLSFAGEASHKNASCYFDNSDAALYVSRAGLQITSAVRDCSKAILEDDSDKTKAKCSMDIAGVINSFAFVAAFLSHAVESCSPMLALSKHAACSANIIDMIAALAGVASTGSGFYNSCRVMAGDNLMQKLESAIIT